MEIRDGLRTEVDAETLAGDLSINSFLKAAYIWGESYRKPGLSPTATMIGGYVRDQRPEAFDAITHERINSPLVGTESLTSVVTEGAIDEQAFTDQSILLENLQNAEPTDSKGTWFDLEFYADGRWRSVVDEIAAFPNEAIAHVRIVDNGKGYLPTDMVLVGGNKRDDPENPAGKFGTGINLSDRSAIGKGVRVVRYSRNWKAMGLLSAQLRSGGIAKVVQYQVFYSGQCLPGSIVEYSQLTPGMFETLRNIQDLYLPLDKTFQERLLVHTEKGSLLRSKDKGSAITVKGRVYQLTKPLKHPFLFSYDLRDCQIDDQHRRVVDTGRVTSNVQAILAEVEDVSFWEDLINNSRAGKECAEFDLDGIQPPAAFIQVLKNIYQLESLDRIYIQDEKTKAHEEKALVRQGYKGIKIGAANFLLKTLGKVGIYTGHDSLGSISESADAQEYENPCLASCAAQALGMLNKMFPGEATMWVVLRDGSRIAYQDFLINDDLKDQIEDFVVTVSGKNFPLGDREQDETFLFPAYELLDHSLAAGLDCAIFNQRLEVAGAKRFGKKAYFDARYWANLPPRDLAVHLAIRNPKEAGELKQLADYSLALKPDYVPMEKTSFGDIVELDGGGIYKKGVKSSAKTKTPFILSYDLKDESNLDVPLVISGIIGQSQRIEVMKAILEKAKIDPYKVYAEYNISCIDRPDLWGQAFRDVFGAEVMLDDTESYPPYPSRVNIQSAVMAQGMQPVRVPTPLVQTLTLCNVPRLSEGVRASHFEVYEPTPAAEAFLLVGNLVDQAIARALPSGVKVDTSAVKVTRSFLNCYGQKLEGKSYLDPLLQDSTIYLSEELMKNEELETLISEIIHRKIALYMNKISSADFALFRSKVLGLLGHTLNVEFRAAFIAAAEQSQNRIIQLLERTREEIQEAITKETKRKIFPDLSRIKSPKGVEAQRAWTRKRFLHWTGGILLSTAVLVGGVEGLKYGGIDVPGMLGLRKKSKSFQRVPLSGSAPIGVTGARDNMSREFMANYVESANSNFITAPSPRWGDFMVESRYVDYIGNGWVTQPTMDFENPLFPQSRRLAHFQKIEGQEVILRTRAGGYIDPRSITLMTAEGTQAFDGQFTSTPLSNGDYQINIKGSGIGGIRYHTLAPINYEEMAGNLTDDDFKKLPADIYRTYTHVPSVDLNAIQFSSSLYPHLTTLSEFLAHMSTFPPFERIQRIRQIIRSSRYTTNKRTEQAFEKFRKGELPEKDFLTFIWNSPELEKPGDGDCDVHNSNFALLARLVGIPTRATFVITSSGAPHGPTEVYLPKIGWVLMDTMGDRIPGEIPPLTRDLPRGTAPVTEAEMDLDRTLRSRVQQCQ